MELFTVLIIAVALGTDAFSMAIGIGACNIRYRQIIIISLVVLVFHIVMPLIGLSLGALLGRAIGRLAEIIGALVLAIIGVLMIREGIKGDEGEGVPMALKPFGLISRKGGKVRVTAGFWGIMVLASSVSLDALTVGFGLGALHFNLTLTVLTIGLVAGIMTALGFLFGKKVGGWLGDKAQVIGGVILVGIGIRMFFF
ncbi:manganese efflux pump MntP family protein [Desulfitibacter alkalitolerans]|uniref:manganese efflux pump MntP n=1 Tax=Desulfitibacter alkalitolerans TaxID=264641 RepID=UPI000480BB0D|nr:manganese efflux pump MntP family protein [Desulfitibacter alkalitolerans]